MAIKEPKFDCKCIDMESLSNLKLALITAKDTYNDIASKLIGMEIKKMYTTPSPEVKKIQAQAKKFDSLIYELEKIPPC